MGKSVKKAMTMIAMFNQKAVRKASDKPSKAQKSVKPSKANKAPPYKKRAATIRKAVHAALKKKSTEEQLRELVCTLVAMLAAPFYLIRSVEALVHRHINLSWAHISGFSLLTGSQFALKSKTPAQEFLNHIHADRQTYFNRSVATLPRLPRRNESQFFFSFLCDSAGF